MAYPGPSGYPSHSYPSSHHPYGVTHPMSPSSPSNAHGGYIGLQPGQYVRPPQPQPNRPSSQYGPPSRPNPPHLNYSSPAPPIHPPRPSYHHASSTPMGISHTPLPNPHEAGYQYSQPQQSQQAPAQDLNDAEYEAVIAASRSSAAEEEARRSRLEQEELRRLEAADQEEKRQREERDRKRQLDEDNELQRVMEQSRLEEETRERETKANEQRALEESKREAEIQQERRRQEEEEELRRVMEQSLREEWERRREAEQEELRMVEVARREIEERQASQQQHQLPYAQDNAVAGSSRGDDTIQGNSSTSRSNSPPASRRPLPTLPRAEHTDESQQHDNTADLGAGEGQSHDPFSDQAEAPPDYDSVHSDRPPNAPDRAPTGIWGTPMPSVHASIPHTDPIEEKRRMEALGQQQQQQQQRQGDDNSPSAFRITNPSLRSANTANTWADQASHRRPLPMPVPNTGPGPDARPNLPSPPSHEARSLPSPPSDSPTQSFQHENSASSTMSHQTSTPATSVGHGHAESAVDKDDESADDVNDLPARSKTRRQSSATIASTVSQSVPTVGQTTPLGIDWGYSDTAFGTELRVGPRHNYRGDTGGGDEAGDESQETTAGKDRFPHIITLTSSGEPSSPLSPSSSGSSAGPFFTIRCGSWRLLLRTLAWLGNTCVEAGPSEVADAAHEQRTWMLRMEVEFVTPSISSSGGFRRTSASSLLAPEHYGVGEYPQGATLQDIVKRAEERLSDTERHQGLAACVSLCISLVPHLGERGKGKATATPTALPDSERHLDMSYLQRGSSRKVLKLPPSSMGLSPMMTTKVKGGFDLPCTLITLAQNLQKAHRFSAACPTSGYTARHTPRDLYHIIDAHDEKFVKKLQQADGGGSAAGGGRNAGTMVATINKLPILLWDPAPPCATNGTAGSVALGASGSADASMTSFDISDAASDYHSHSHIGRRVKNKVKKKWRGRQGEVEDGTEEELRNWITPLDLSEVG